MLRWIPGLALIAAGCASVAQTPPRREVVFFNGHIYTSATASRAVDALLVHDGVVVAAGSRADVEGRALDAKCEHVDLDGGFVVPGLQDAHGHFEGLGRALETVDLVGAQSYAEVVHRVVDAAVKAGPGAWIEGRGWNQNLWPGQQFPHHRVLSEAVPDHPVVLSRVDGHAVLVNRRVLELAGLDHAADSEDVVPGGRMLLDDEHKPTGVFVDAAEDLVTRVMPEPYDSVRERRMLLAQEHLLSVGLTAVHDMGIGRSSLAVLERLRDAGKLKIRLIEYLSDPGSADDFARHGASFAADPRGLLRVAGVKLYADGALGSRGAALLEPYSDEPSNSGLMQITQDELARRVRAYADLGLQPAIHAIGDRANRVVLDVYDAQMQRDPRFALLRPRIEHAQVVAPSDWPRFAKLGVVPSMQPTHATSDMRWAGERLGPKRIAGAYAWRKLAPDTTQLAFGSDFPVEDSNPLLGLYAAVTRQDAGGWPDGGFAPDQRLSASEALSAFTAGAARAVHEEVTRGALLPGYFADMTVLDVDPLHCKPSELLAARVRLTVVDGEVVYSAPKR